MYVTIPMWAVGFLVVVFLGLMGSTIACYCYGRNALRECNIILMNVSSLINQMKCFEELRERIGKEANK